MNKKDAPLYILAELLYVSGTANKFIKDIRTIQRTQSYSTPKESLSFYMSPLSFTTLVYVSDDVFSDSFNQKLQIRMQEALLLHSKLMIKMNSVINNAINSTSNDEFILKIEELIATSRSLDRIAQYISSNLSKFDK